MIDILNNIHTFAAYTGILTIVIYLILYTATFNWYTSRVGWMLNLTLIGIILLGIGATFSTQGILLLLAKPLIIIGWTILSGSMVWRSVSMILSRQAHNKIVKNVSTEIKSNPETKNTP